MKKLIKLFLSIAIVFSGLNAFAAGGYFNPNLDVREVRASHILVSSRKEALQLKKEIKNGDITFEDAAIQYSQCPSGRRGGDLGYFNKGDMVEEFEEAAYNLKVNEYTKEPIKTSYGYHIILKTDEKINKYNGIFDLPRELNMDAKILYINRNGNPRKYIFKYKTASESTACGVFSQIIICCENIQPITAKAILKMQNTKRAVFIEFFILW